ncbi:hypothetical protein TRICI_002563 [Trichomonascus ciferrii]|uniref:Uncharacterized protein n=1 Tax=Trichomonascus ciferrii TaxID=44093 RepID=A0A642V600_9ASCO|nr:hypothetical protein TRICI_002563 [Trichomonascus ciferrii]
MVGIETDIQSLELESESIEDLRRQYDVLSVEKGLSTMMEMQQQMQIEGEEDGMEEMGLQQLYQEKLHRMTGVSAFRVKNGFGIRIELFSNAQFLSPHYMILRKNTKGLLEVYRHTIPAFIPLAKYQQDYLNVNMRLFVKKVRGDLMRILEKQTIFMEKLPHVKNVEVDPAFRLIKLHLDTEGTAYLICSDDYVKRAVVKDHPREQDWERLLLGPIDQLKSRLELAG